MMIQFQEAHEWRKKSFTRMAIQTQNIQQHVHSMIPILLAPTILDNV